VNGVAETSSEESRAKITIEQVPQVPVVTSVDMRGGVEENALRDAIYRSSRSGWTNNDRSRQQLQQNTVRRHLENGIYKIKNIVYHGTRYTTLRCFFNLVYTIFEISPAIGRKSRLYFFTIKTSFSF